MTFCDEMSGCFVAVEVRRGMGLYGPKHRDFFGEIYKQSNIKTSVSDSLDREDMQCCTIYSVIMWITKKVTEYICEIKSIQIPIVAE